MICCRKLKTIFIFASIINVIVFGAIIVVGDGEATLVSINPVSQSVNIGDTFNVNVSCVPGQAIKSFEFKLFFNATLLQANSVSEGDIFDGYNTFFNNGTINNTAGTIVDIYDLIVGVGNVSDLGTLVTVSFTALDAIGVSYLNLIDVGVTNETEYLPVNVSNGTISIEEYYTLTVNIVGSGSVIKNPDKASYNYNEIVTLTANANTGWTFDHWSGNLTGSTNPTTITMNNNKTVIATFTQNTYTLTINTVGSGTVTKNPNKTTYNYNEIVTLTANANTGWTFDHWSGNLTGSTNPTTITMNSNKAVTATFMDSAAPEIDNVVVTSSSPLDTDPVFGWINITVDVTDNVAVNITKLCIKKPIGTWNNISMNIFDIDTYYYSGAAFSSYGNYSYFIWADDTSENDNSSVVYTFSMPPNWDINIDGNCSVFDLVLISNHYDELGVSGWIREDVDNNGKIEVLDLVLTANNFDFTGW